MALLPCPNKQLSDNDKGFPSLDSHFSFPFIFFLIWVTNSVLRSRVVNNHMFRSRNWRFWTGKASSWADLASLLMLPITSCLNDRWTWKTRPLSWLVDWETRRANKIIPKTFTRKINKNLICIHLLSSVWTNTLQENACRIQNNDNLLGLFCYLTRQIVHN